MDKKFCPQKVGNNLYCCENECGWWIEYDDNSGNCAIADIALSMEE